MLNDESLSGCVQTLPCGSPSLRRLRGLQLYSGLVAWRELDACRFEGALNSKTLFICRRAKSVLNLPEQANAETCSRAEPVARPTEKLPRDRLSPDRKSTRLNSSH